MIWRIGILLMFAFPVCSLGQEKTALGSVMFKGKSAKLSVDTKKALVSFIPQLQKDTSLNIELFITDIWSCAPNTIDPSWDRINNIVNFYTKNGISENRFVFRYFLGDSDRNKISLFLAPREPIIPPTPHPNLKKKM